MDAGNENRVKAALLRAADCCLTTGQHVGFAVPWGTGIVDIYRLWNAVPHSPGVGLRCVGGQDRNDWKYLVFRTNA